MVSRRVMCAALAMMALMPVSARAAELDEATIKSLIMKPWAGAKFTWRTIQMAPPRKASSGEINSAGLPPNATVTVVRVDYTRVLGDGGRDVKQQYLFYVDDFQQWTMQADSVPYNATSDLYYVKP